MLLLYVDFVEFRVGEYFRLIQMDVLWRRLQRHVAYPAAEGCRLM